MRDGPGAGPIDCNQPSCVSKRQKNKTTTRCLRGCDGNRVPTPSGESCPLSIWTNQMEFNLGRHAGRCPPNNWTPAPPGELVPLSIWANLSGLVTKWKPTPAALVKFKRPDQVRVMSFGEFARLDKVRLLNFGEVQTIGPGAKMSFGEFAMDKVQVLSKRRKPCSGPRRNVLGPSKSWSGSSRSYSGVCAGVPRLADQQFLLNNPPLAVLSAEILDRTSTRPRLQIPFQCGSRLVLMLAKSSWGPHEKTVGKQTMNGCHDPTFKNQQPQCNHVGAPQS